MRAPKRNKIPNKSGIKPIVHNVFILDCSGSMGSYQGSKYMTALESINEELLVLSKNEDVTFTQTLVEFGSHKSIHITRYMSIDHSALPIRRNDLGMTALNDTILLTLNKLRSDKKPEEKVLVKILTDGGENDSIVANSTTIKELMATCEKEGFTITFIGTTSDTVIAIGAYGLHVSNTMSHDNTSAGIKAASQFRTASTMSYSKGVADGVDVTENFFTKTLNINDSN